jgi:hypothetical protein
LPALIVESLDNVSMFVRGRTARDHGYLYLVENERDGARVRQRIIRALGHKDVLLASGELDRLAASLVRHCGWLADRVGRKLLLMVSIAWYSLANLLAGLTPIF